VSASLLNVSCGGRLSLESSLSPRGSQVTSGLISFSRGDSGYALVCILPLSLSSTLVSLLDPTVPPVLSLPGAVRKDWAYTDGSRCLTPGAVLACANPLSPRGSWGDSLTARVLESTQSSGWVSSGKLRPLSAIGNGLLFVGPNSTPKFYGTWTGSALLDNPGAHNILRQVSS